MDKRFQIDRIYSKRNFLGDDIISLDNGEVKASLDVLRLRTRLQSAGVPYAGIVAIMKKLERYANQVDTEKAKGVHLGSSSLAISFSAEVQAMNPQDLGLQTQTEVKLAAALIEQFTQEFKI